MKKGVIVLLSLGLLAVFCAPVAAQPNSRAVETFIIDDFDDNAGAQEYKFEGQTLSWQWKVQASRFVEEGFPKMDYFEGIPNSLKVLKSGDKSPKVLGVKSKFARKGENWFEVYPSNEDKPYEIPFKGTVTQLDFWVWGANYLYFIDVLVRDSDGRVHALPAGNLAFNGWRNVIVSIPTYLRQHSRLRSGPSSMMFVGFRVRTDPDEYVDDFNIFFDQIKYTTNALADVFDGYELKNIDFGESSGASSEAK